MSDDIAKWAAAFVPYCINQSTVLTEAVEADVVALVDSLTEEAMRWMKDNARWQDRSGDARAGLWADMEHVVHEAVYLLLSHDVTLDYTWFLEANPKFAVLGDAADYMRPMIQRGVSEIVRRYSV